MANKAQAKPIINNFFFSSGFCNPSFFTKITKTIINEMMSGMANNIMLALYG